MDAREKSVLSQRLKEDRLSQLPDPLIICHILSHLPIKQVVKTSVLSTRWRSLWLWLPSLEMELECWNFSNSFMSFGDRFFDPNRVSCIENLKLTICIDSSYITSWIVAAVTRKIQHLDLCCHDLHPFVIPTSMYTSETLVSLKLSQATLASAKFFSLPRVKTLHLKSISYTDEAIFERLVSSCSVLEELEVATFLNDKAIVFRVCSTSLKKLNIRMQQLVYAYCSGVVIDAPLLSYLSINVDLSQSFVVIKKMQPNAKLDISCFNLILFYEIRVSSKRNSIGRFLSQISEVKDMTICNDTLKVICHYSKLELLPQFSNMSRVQATLHHSKLEELLTFLKSCPNLKSLILVCDGIYEELLFKEMSQISFSYMPQCFLPSLEFIDLKFPIRVRLKIVRYFLENTPMLKKLTLHLADYSIQEMSTFKEALLKMTRSSSECDIVVLDWY
ncbi:hypothetical protein CARUB_v10027508mg [Capsella rubella]|uniref:FBD domain-containing protein n=1 Tax=Capsella rubella TaxID=81985 RepID=R0GK03_9BRAS|nr:hypothetical protein CARUB_v10027508mg [Capsella rubella]